MTQKDLLKEFYEAPDNYLFNQIVIAAVLDCSTDSLEKDRWYQTHKDSRGEAYYGKDYRPIPYYKINGKVRYKKSDILAYIEDSKIS